MAKRKKSEDKEIQKVEVVAEEVVAVDNNGEETPLTEIVPETAGEIVTAEVPTSVESTVEETTVPVEAEVLPEITEENKDDVKEAAPVKKTRAKRTKVTKTEKPAEKKSDVATTAAKLIEKTVWCYPTSVATKAIKTISGTVYLWDGKEVTGRYAVTDKVDGAGKLSALCGWVDKADLGME